MTDALTEKLERALADLGDTPEAVAAYLEGQGVCGTKGHYGACPVALYLARVLGTHPEVLQAATWVDSACVEYVDNPQAVRDFIARFDAGHYPQLEAR